MNLPDIISSVQRVAGITGALCRAVAAGLGRGRMEAAVIVRVWRRIRRVENLLRALVTRLERAPIRCVRVAPVDGVAPRRARTARACAAGPALPQRKGWLLDLVPGEAACLASQLQIVLDEPVMVALLAERPEAVRILRPLCRMLGLDMAYTQSAVMAAPDCGVVGSGLPAEWPGEIAVADRGVALPVGWPALRTA